MPCNIKIVDGFHHLSGSIDEFFVELQPKFESKNIKFNLKGIKSINSQGILFFLKFIGTLAEHSIEFHECSPVVVDMVNTFPGILGVPHKPEIVKSMLIEYCCVGCTFETMNLMKIKGPMTFDIEGTDRCPKCSERLEMRSLIEELLVFHSDLTS